MYYAISHGEQKLAWGTIHCAIVLILTPAKFQSLSRESRYSNRAVTTENYLLWETPNSLLCYSPMRNWCNAWHMVYIKLIGISYLYVVKIKGIPMFHGAVSVLLKVIILSK